MPSQAVSAPVPHLGGTAAAAVRAGFAGLADAARAVAGIAIAAQVRARAARPRRATRAVGFMCTLPWVRVFPGPATGITKSRQLRRPEGRNGWNISSTRVSCPPEWLLRIQLA